ncbi:hypothetical protein [Marinobacter nauticus]|uniref:hypothetical protein n=1 Tax=Marinobacter nauticus TaxID=2743 RepID=UPI0009F89EA5|nr:hypothetical protein [Marinobacter nauticus]
MKQQATHSEILLIASLVLRINELNTGHILTIDIHQSGLRLMTFDCDNRIEGCETIYQFRTLICRSCGFCVIGWRSWNRRRWVSAGRLWRESVAHQEGSEAFRGSWSGSGSDQ